MVQGFILLLIQGLQLVLLAYVILSWVQMGRQISRSVPRLDDSNPVVRFIDDIATAVLYPIRRLLAPVQRNIPLDLSVIVAFLLLQLLSIIVVNVVRF